MARKITYNTSLIHSNLVPEEDKNHAKLKDREEIDHNVVRRLAAGKKKEKCKRTYSIVSAEVLDQQHKTCKTEGRGGVLCIVRPWKNEPNHRDIRQWMINKNALLVIWLTILAEDFPSEFEVTHYTIHYNEERKMYSTSWKFWWLWMIHSKWSSTGLLSRPNK